VDTFFVMSGARALLLLSIFALLSTDYELRVAAGFLASHMLLKVRDCFAICCRAARLIAIILTAFGLCFAP
jgi:hypothetical protein